MKTFLSRNAFSILASILISFVAYYVRTQQGQFELLAKSISERDTRIAEVRTELSNVQEQMNAVNIVVYQRLATVEAQQGEILRQFQRVQTQLDDFNKKK